MNKKKLKIGHFQKPSKEKFPPKKWSKGYCTVLENMYIREPCLYPCG